MGEPVNGAEQVGDGPDVQHVHGLRPGPVRSADGGHPGPLVGQRQVPRVIRMRSPAGRPPRSIAALIDPAEVPTMTAAVRGSQPVTSARAPSTAPW